MRTPRELFVAAPVAACLLVCAGVLAAGAAHGQAQLYRWVDDKGVTHFSDRPVEGAEKVAVPAAQGYQPRPVQQRAATPPAAPPDGAAAFVAYGRVEIVRPANDEAFVNTGAAVDVAAALDPPLAPGHRTWFVLNGQRLQGVAPGSTSTSLEAERGSHTIAVEIVDESGNIVASSAPVTFHVRQNSIAQPPRGPALIPPQRPTPLPAPVRPRP